MKLLKNLIFPLALLTLMFTSCDRDNSVDETNIDESPTEVNVNPLVGRSLGGNGDGMDFDCFLIKYTFSFVDIDDNEYPISSDEDFINLLDSSEELQIVDFKYPLTIITDSGESQANSEDDLEALFASCVPSGGWEEGEFPAFSINYDNSCYELVYPVSVRNDAGDVTVLDNEEAFNDAMAADLVYFVFPLDLIEEDGTASTVEDIDMLFTYLIGCNGFGPSDTLIGAEWDWEGGFEYLGCYMLQFPFDVNLADGTAVTVNNHEELCDLMLTGELVDYAYPLTLEDEDNVEYVVNSEAELETLLIECDYIWVGDFEGDVLVLLSGAGAFENEDPCYVISFPIEIANGIETTSIASLEEMQEILFGEPQSLVYPLNVVLESDGSIYTVEGIESLFDLLTICE